MRISILILGVVFSLSGCKKVYQCECRQILNGEDWNPIVTNVAIEETKSNAATQCDALEYSFGWQDYKTCDIK
jgi:hypothetical protein